MAGKDVGRRETLHSVLVEESECDVHAVCPFVDPSSGDNSSAGNRTFVHETLTDHILAVPGRQQPRSG
jgi:ferredoxin